MTDKRQTSKEFLAGCIAGFSKIYSGQPFDIVKVRLQSMQGETKPSALSVAMNIIKNEGGVFALWKGSLPPLLAVSATVSLQFGVNENVKRMIFKANGGKKMSFGELFLAGGLGGLANCIVSTPAEHFRIRIQTQPKTAPLYNGSIDCMKKIFSQYGLRGVYKGVVPTIYRDSLGYAVYFAMYTTLLDKFAPGKQRSEYSLGTIGLAGSLAGISLWTSVFPLDVVKTRIQTDRLDNPQYKGIVDCFRQVYQTKGFKGFWQGYVPCLARAVPVNGIVFMLYEVLYRQMIAPPKPRLAIA